MPAPSPTSAQLVSINDAAEFLGVDTQTVRRMIGRGELAGYRVGTSRLIRVDLAQITGEVLRPIPVAGGGDRA